MATLLGLTYAQYCDMTLFELTFMIEGHNMRWEEQWRHTRSIYGLLFNINAPKEKQKSERQLMPLPSERKDIKWEEWIENKKNQLKREAGKDVITGG